MLQTYVSFHRALDVAPSGTLRVEVPVTALEALQGLSGRPSLPDDTGMLFDMGTEGHHQFHMIGVAFPLDFIFVTSDRRVDVVFPGQPPGLPRIGSLARWIIEAPAGWAARHNIRPGTFVALP